MNRSRCPKLRSDGPEDLNLIAQPFRGYSYVEGAIEATSLGSFLRWAAQHKGKPGYEVQTSLIELAATEHRSLLEKLFRSNMDRRRKGQLLRELAAGEFDSFTVQAFLGEITQ
jgi:hypothetical protein